MSTYRIIPIDEPSVTLPPMIYYLDRVNSQVLTINLDNINRTSFKGKIPFYRDSAVLYLSASDFLIVGGQKTSNKFSKKVFRLSTSLDKVHRLPKLPLPTKGGSLCYYKSCIYLIGACTISDSEVCPCPILRYSLNEKLWEILDVNDLHIDSKFSTNNILHPNPLLIGRKVFLLSGSKLTSNSLTKRIFSIDLSENSLRMKQERFCLPTKLFNLKSAYFNKEIIICGSEQLDNTQSSLIFLFSLKSQMWKALGSFKLSSCENYPTLVMNGSVIFISSMDIVVKDNAEIGMFCFSKEEVKEEVKRMDAVFRAKTLSFDEGLLGEELKKEKADGRKRSFERAEEGGTGKRKRLKERLNTLYSKSNAPMLPSNIIMSGGENESESSEESESDSSGESEDSR